MKKFCVLGALLCGLSLQAMDDQEWHGSTLEERVAFFRAVAAGQLRVIGQHQIAFPAYESGRHVKSPQEIKRLYECGLAYKASGLLISRQDETANWIVTMFNDFIDDTDLALDVSILKTTNPDMAALLEASSLGRMEQSSDIENEFATIISELKEKRGFYKDGLGSGELGQLQAVLDLPVNLFVKPLRAIAYDEKNKESGEQLIPESWSSSPQMQEK
jgi:hypothetical protein